MAVEETTDTAPVVDTSTNEEALETDVETSLEEDTFSFEDESDDETEESEESTEDEAATESDDETEEESEEDEGNQSPDEESKEEDTASEVDSKQVAARKAFEEREQRRLANEKQDQIKQQQQKDYLDAAEDEKDLALRQLQVDAYNNRVEGITNKLENGIGAAFADIDLFRKGTDVEKEELISSLEDFEAKFVVRDQNGDPVDIKIDPKTGKKADVYQHLQNKAESIRRLTGIGARSEQKAKKLTKARTDTVPSRSPKQAKVDPDLEAFDEIAKRGW